MEGQRLIGNCPSCGNPIFVGLKNVGKQLPDLVFVGNVPEVTRTCNCFHDGEKWYDPLRGAERVEISPTGDISPKDLTG